MITLTEVHNELVNAVQANQLVIFAGAGISKSAGFPLWGELLDAIIAAVNNNNSQHTVNLAARKQESLFAVLEYLESNSLSDYVESVFYEKIALPSRNFQATPRELPLHEKILQLSGKVITTNYDTLFEQCNRYKKISPDKYVTNQTAINWATVPQSFLYKMHGDIEAGGRIFFPSEYKNLYSNIGFRFNAEHLFASKTILFLGTSMTDPYINSIIDFVQMVTGNTARKNFFLTNDELDDASLVRIKGDPVEDTEALLDNLLQLKNDKKAIQRVQLPKRMVPVENMVSEICATRVHFPAWEKFEGVYVNPDLVELARKRFSTGLGPMLFYGRWGTGKTLAALKIGYELRKAGYAPYCLNPAEEQWFSDSALLEEYKKKILEKYGEPKTVFIIEDVHLYPEAGYDLCNYAIQHKLNCIFLSRPVSKEVREKYYYFPELFSEQNQDGEPGGDAGPPPVLLPFIPDAEAVKFLFKQRLAELRMEAAFDEEKCLGFAREIGFNLSLLAMHLHRLTEDSKNVFKVDYDAVESMLAKHYPFDYHELFQIAALSVIDRKADLGALFTEGDIRKLQFKEKATNQLNNRKSMYWMYSAEARVLLEVAIRKNYVRDDSGGTFVTVEQALFALLRKYALRNPVNLNMLFFALLNYEFECTRDGQLSEADFIYSSVSALLQDEQIAGLVKARIKTNTRNVVSFGGLMRVLAYYRLQPEELERLVDPETITHMLDNLKRYYNRDLLITWQYKFSWSALRALNRDLASHLIAATSDEMILKYASSSISGLSGFFELSCFEDRCYTLLFGSAQTLIASVVKEKFSTARELPLYWLFHYAVKIDNKHTASAVKLFDLLTKEITPEKYLAFVKGLNKPTMTSFILASRYLGCSYMQLLNNSFEVDAIAKIVYGRELHRVNGAYDHNTWSYFLNTILPTLLLDTGLHDIALFIRNIALHGFSKQNKDGAIAKLKEPGIQNVIASKFAEGPLDSISSFLWHLKSLDIGVFDKYAELCVGEVASKSFIAEAPPRVLVSVYISLGCFSEQHTAGELLEPEQIKRVCETDYTRRSARDFMDQQCLAFLSDNKMSAVPWGLNIQMVLSRMIYAPEALPEETEPAEYIVLNKRMQKEGELLIKAAYCATAYKLSPTLFFGNRLRGILENMQTALSELYSQTGRGPVFSQQEALKQKIYTTFSALVHSAGYSF